MVKNLFTSRIFLLIIILFTVLDTYQNKRWKTLSIIHDDAINYYAYLPAAVIFQDLTFGFVDSLPPEIQKKIYRTTTYDNHVVQKMTMGVSILLLPFFSLAHLYSVINDLSAIGYSEPYEFSIILAALFYFAAGMFFLRRSLKIYYTDAVVSITLVIVALATNLFYYTTYESAMSHVYSFFLFSILLWLIIKWHEKPSVKISIFTGVTLGLITLVRPTNCLVFIFFALYGVIDTPSFSNKIKFFRNNWQRVLIIGFSTFLPLSFQLIYWKFATGHWFHYSYHNERFFFNNPHMWEGLLGFRKGFFIYTPVMIMIIPGIWYAFKQKEKYWLALTIFFIINVYVIFSWWCWWYGGSFGSRPMVDSYALLALPLATFTSKCFRGGWIKKVVLVLFTMFFIKLNLFQIDQVKSTLLHWDSMNARTYLKIFGTKSFPEKYELMLTPTDAENASKGLPEREILHLNIYKLQVLYSYKISVKASNGKYMCAEAGENGKIICNRDNPYEWETFKLNRYPEKVCTIQSFKKKYLGVDMNSGNRLFAKKDTVEQTELFRLVDLGSNTFALKAFDGSFITLHNNSLGELIIGAPTIGKPETFILDSK